MALTEQEQQESYERRQKGGGYLPPKNGLIDYSATLMDQVKAQRRESSLYPGGPPERSAVTGHYYDQLIATMKMPTPQQREAAKHAELEDIADGFETLSQE